MIETLELEPQTIPSPTRTEREQPTLPPHVILAAKHYTDMVQGKPEHWMTSEQVRKSIYQELGWK